MDILTYISRFIQPEQITELRAFDSDGIVYSGWFEHKYLSRLASIATDLDRTNRYKGIYFVPNPIEFELLDRRKNKIGQGGSCTADKDILFRKWLLIDIDPVRPANVSATESERQHAWQVCSHVQSAPLPAASQVRSLVHPGMDGICHTQYHCPITTKEITTANNAH